MFKNKNQWHYISLKFIKEEEIKVNIVLQFFTTEHWRAFSVFDLENVS